MDLFTQLALITTLAAALGLAMDRLKQPALLGYILAGIFVSTWGVFQFRADELITSLGEIGVTLLLFLIGMELSWPKLKAVGRASIFVGSGQIIFTFLGGWTLAYLLGFTPAESAYIAIALTLSSTIIVIKLLGEKRDTYSLYGRIAIGTLLVQDFAAILILVFLTSLSVGSWTPTIALSLLAKFSLLVIGVIGLSRYIVPKVVSWVAHSTELLFLSAVAWGVGMAAFLGSEAVGFSIEVGGFVAGITLANAIEQHQILSRLRPLRDFFIMLFFVSLGSSLTLSGITDSLSLVFILSFFVLIGNPLIVFIIMRHLKYRARTSFFTSLTMAQISEFSLIVVALGMKLGHVSETILSIVTLVGVITMTGSTYLILNAEKLWRKYGKWIKKLEVKGSHDFNISGIQDWKNHVVLIGCHRTGRRIWQKLKRKGEQVLIVDFNPEMIKKMSTLGAEVFYGDTEDIENLELINLDKAKMIISTVVDYEATLMLLEYLKNHVNRKSLIIVVTAAYVNEAKEFYQKGADYVSVPRWMTGIHLADLLSKSLKQGKDAIKNRAEWEKEEFEETC